MNKSFSSVYIYLVFFIILFLQACSTHRPPADRILDQKAGQLAARTRSINQQILSSRGTGWVRLTDIKQTQRYKIAWAAVFPDKIRFTLMVSGMPLETVIADGRMVSFTSHTNSHRPYQIHSKSPDLKKIIDIPVKVSELILVLLGRFPVSSFNDIYFSPDDPSLSTVVLTQNWPDLRQVITLDKTEEIKELTWKTNQDKLVFKIVYHGYQTMDGQRISNRLEISDDNNRKVSLDILNFQANPTIKDTVFRLTAHGS